MKKPKDLNLDTLSLHAGSKPDKEFGSRATPIYQTSSFVFPDSETAAGIFNNEMAGHVYSRITNPTNAVLEERISSLEGGIGAISTASGQAALFLAITTILGKNSHIVASKSLYGGSHNTPCLDLVSRLLSWISENIDKSEMRFKKIQDCCSGKH